MDEVSSFRHEIFNLTDKLTQLSTTNSDVFYVVFCTNISYIGTFLCFNEFLICNFVPLFSSLPALALSPLLTPYSLIGLPFIRSNANYTRIIAIINKCSWMCFIWQVHFSFCANYNSQSKTLNIELTLSICCRLFPTCNYSALNKLMFSL